jgi:Protein of unknown function (DUF3768)
MIEVIRAVQTTNDPYGEHDCVPLRVANQRVMFKSDYYNPPLPAIRPPLLIRRLPGAC